jgi:mannose-6-phosphate isomerase-like protein (cupin superfamily)
MPIVKPNGSFPKWCEVRQYEILQPTGTSVLRLQRKSPKEKLMVAEGACELSVGDRSFQAVKGEQYDLAGAGLGFEVKDAVQGTVLIRICGSWGEETGGSGFFEVRSAEVPRNTGDEAPYPRNTDFDRHYHDCDEYYILYEGRGVVVTEGKTFEAAAGDCVAIGKGHHHDIPTVKEPVKAVYFEATMQGQKRQGHLWEHTHGPAQPETDRV